MKTTFSSEFMSAAKDAPRMFFAPVVGAAKAIIAEFRRIDEASTPTGPAETSTKR